MRRRTLEAGNKIEWDANGRAIIDGYEAVDLGDNLDFVIATCSIGAASELQKGIFYKYGAGSTNYEGSSNYYNGLENPLDISKDTARLVMGGRWRMPTRSEMNALIDRTSASIDYNLLVYKLTSKQDVNRYIYFPPTGYNFCGSIYSLDAFGMWTSSPFGDNVLKAYYFYLSSEAGHGVSNSNRYMGRNIRGVISKSELGL